MVRRQSAESPQEVEEQGQKTGGGEHSRTHETAGQSTCRERRRAEARLARKVPWIGG